MRYLTIDGELSCAPTSLSTEPGRPVLVGESDVAAPPPISAMFPKLPAIDWSSPTGQQTVVLDPSSKTVDEAESAAVDGDRAGIRPAFGWARRAACGCRTDSRWCGAGRCGAPDDQDDSPLPPLPRTAAILPERRAPNGCQPPPNGLPADRPECRSARGRTGSTGLSDMLTPEGPVMRARLPESPGESHRLSTPVATAQSIECRRRGPSPGSALPASGQGAPPGKAPATTTGQRATISSLG